MATDLATPSNTLAKVRWREQYVSEGLNKKLNGLVPAGVIRGGRLGTNVLDLRITIEADPDTGDSIYSFIDSNGQQLTFRQVGDVTLDLTALASTTVYIGLEIVYTTSAATEVYWRAYSQAEIDADPTIVCLGPVDVPASGLIPEGNIRGDRRVDGGMNLSAGTRGWRQVVPNPSFEGGEISVVPPPGTVSRELPGWLITGGAFGGWEMLTPGTSPAAQPRSGENTLSPGGGGPGSESLVAQVLGAYRVTPGQMVRCSVWARGTGASLGSGAAAKVGIKVTAYQWDGTVSAAGSPWSSGILEIVEDGTVITGTFDYLEIAETFKVPADVAYITLALEVVDSVGFVGRIEFDDFRVWLEPGPIVQLYDPERPVVGNDVQTSELIVTPYFGQDSVVDSDTMIERAIRLLCSDATSGGLAFNWEPVKAAVTSWLMSFPKGRLDLGSDLNNTDAEGLIPRITTDNYAGLANDYTLLWEMNPTGGTFTSKIRIYTGVAFTLASAYRPVVITVNAYWDGTDWDFDDSSEEATRIELGQYGIYFYSKDAGSTAPWTDSNWTNPATDAYEYFSVYNSTNGNAQVILNNARIAIENSDVETNPAYTVTPLANALYAKNIAKAFSYFGLNAGTVVGEDGFNLQTGTVGATLPLNFNRAMANANYAVVIGVDNIGATGFYFPVVLNQGTSGFELDFFFASVASGILVDAANNVSGGYFSVAVLGEQDS